MFVSLSRDWTERTVVLIGGGPSAARFDLHALRGSCYLVVAINDAGVYLPWADCLFSIDTLWMRRRRDLIRGFAGERLMAVPEREVEFGGERQVVRVNAFGLSDDPSRLCSGGNSGYAALGMAIMRGCQDIVLVGYDMSGPGHWHAGYEWRSRYGAGNYRRWADGFRGLATHATARGVRVGNANPRSAITAFPYTSVLEEIRV